MRRVTEADQHFWDLMELANLLVDPPEGSTARVTVEIRGEDGRVVAFVDQPLGGVGDPLRGLAAAMAQSAAAVVRLEDLVAQSPPQPLEESTQE